MNITSKIWIAVRILFALFMIMGGVQHFIKPEFYVPFVPDFLPFSMVIIYVSGFVEIALGLFLLFKKSAKNAALGIFMLLLLFLPIHVWDIITDTPAIGSHKAAWIRLSFQFLFLAIAWKIKQISSITSK